MIFAALVLEREPLQWGELPAAFVSWVQVVGTIAAIGLVIWLIALYAPQALAALDPKLSASLRSKLPGMFQGDSKSRTLEGKVFAGAIAVGGILYAIALLLLIGRGLGILGGDEAPPAPLRGLSPTTATAPLFASAAELFFTLASAAALITAALPILMALFGRLKGRRIWALARVSLKEALHSRVVLIFSLMGIIFLFADWFVPYRPEDQLRNYVRAIYWTMPFLFLMTASILGAFTIPNDLRRQTIHTIVTKPVERFEIFLGRFVGFGVLITVGMIILSGLSLIYVVRGVGEAAAKESYKARMPIYGALTFWGTRDASKGDNVGRIWDYRSYITGRDPRLTGQSRQFAIWSFNDIPNFGDKDTVHVEFTFDIFRLSKGVKERPGIPCTFYFVDGRLDIPQIEEMADKHFKKRANTLRAQNKTPEQIEETLIQNMHMVVRGGEKVIDYTTQSLKIPALFFKTLREDPRPDPKENLDKNEADYINDLRDLLNSRAKDGYPAFKVIVEVEEDRITQQTQMLGVARRDLYLLPTEGSFEVNFLKGMVGLWLLVLLVLGVALALSTYLSGVIALLCTVFLLLAGMNRDFIADVASGRADGGGPLESGIRLARARPIASPLEPGAGYDLVKGVDEGFRGILLAFLNILPDVERFDLHEYVASGFDISGSQVLLLNNLVYFLGYLVPWSILAYYLLRFREIANPG